MLSPKQILFCEEYLMGMAKGDANATAAYKIVYKGITDSAAVAAASRLLNSVNVQEYIKQRKTELSQKYDISKDYLVQELFELIDSCKKEGMDGKGTIKDRTNWTKAVGLLAKITGHDVQKVEHSGSIQTNYVLQIPGAERPAEPAQDVQFIEYNTTQQKALGAEPDIMSDEEDDNTE